MEYNTPRPSSALKLNETNYLSWAEAVEAYLKARDIWDIVEGYNPMPTVDKDDKKTVAAYRVWRKKDWKVWFNIRSFCNQVNIAFYKPETVKELWDCLKATKKSIETIYYLAQMRAFINYKQGSKETVKQMLFTVRTIQMKVTVLSLSTLIYDNMLWEIFFEALREELYDLMIFWIQNKTVKLSVQDTLHLLKEKEIKQMLNNSAKNVTVNSANAEHLESHQCQCQHQHHEKDVNAAEKICFQCQRTDHFTYDCFTKINKDSKEILPNNSSKMRLKFEVNTKKAENSKYSKYLKNLSSHTCDANKEGRA